MSLPPGSSSLSAVEPTPERDDVRTRFAPTSSDEESNVLRHYVGVLRRRYLWIVLGLVVGLVGGYISTLFVTAKVDPNRYYKATNTLIAPSVSGSSGETNTATNVQTVAFLVNSAQVTNKVAKQLNLPTETVTGLVTATARSDVNAVDVTAHLDRPEASGGAGQRGRNRAEPVRDRRQPAAVQPAARRDREAAQLAEEPADRPREPAHQAGRQQGHHQRRARLGGEPVPARVRELPDARHQRRADGRPLHRAGRYARADQRPRLLLPPGAEPERPGAGQQCAGHAADVRRDRPQHRPPGVEEAPAGHRRGRRAGDGHGHRVPGRSLGRSGPPAGAGRGPDRPPRHRRDPEADPRPGPRPRHPGHRRPRLTGRRALPRRPHVDPVLAGPGGRPGRVPRQRRGARRHGHLAQPGRGQDHHRRQPGRSVRRQRHAHAGDRRRLPQAGRGPLPRTVAQLRRAG